MQELGQTIRKYRNKKGYTLSELAIKLDISIGLLSNIENNKTDSFQLNLLNNIVNELDIPITELRLFSKPYKTDKLDMPIPKYINKIKPSLDSLIESFIETASALGFAQSEVTLVSDMLISELRAINKILKTTKSK